MGLCCDVCLRTDTGHFQRAHFLQFQRQICSCHLHSRGPNKVLQILGFRLRSAKVGRQIVRGGWDVLWTCAFEFLSLLWETRFCTKETLENRGCGQNCCPNKSSKTMIEAELLCGPAMLYNIAGPCRNVQN